LPVIVRKTMIAPRIACLLGLALGGLGSAQADIYKCTDEQGHVTYTNQKTSVKGCALLSKDQAVSTIEGPKRAAAPAASPASFPKVDGETQKKRDGDRRRILEEELAAEEKGLEQARKQLSEQESVRLGDEKNYQRVLDRLQPYKDKVALHERNIEALKREIGNLR
jgi:hypothetical protein